MAEIDLDKLPVVSNRIGLLKYDPFKEFPGLAGLEAISERIYGCNLFIGAQPDSSYPFYVEKARLRAALNELVSLSEMLRDNHDELVIDRTTLPLLHFFKELRVTNFHLKTFSSEMVEGETVFVTSDGTMGAETFPHSRFVISDCNIHLFSENANFKKHYRTSDAFHQTVEWVAENQRIWGIAHLLEITLRQYCELIQNHFASDANCKSNI